MSHIIKEMKKGKVMTPEKLKMLAREEVKEGPKNKAIKKIKC